MIQRLRSHLTYANVMVTILAFIVLGGGTALASFVVSSNSQVGPGTISGHKPPTGDHANIIAGSVSGPDISNLSFKTLTLKNGWAGGKNCNSGTGGVPGIAESVEGVVYFRGNICRKTGSSYNPFTVPADFRPSNDEYLPVAQSGFGGGGIIIESTGKVTVEEGPDFQNAGAVLTSLDGVSYTLPF